MKRRIIFFYLLLYIICLAQTLEAKTGISLAGTSGLINVPTAEILSDGTVVFGVNYIRKPYALFGRPSENNIAYYSTIGYLPFTEISLRITRYARSEHYPRMIGDRMASFRIQLLKEKPKMPAICFGIRDVTSVFGGKGANHFNALYMVSSKIFIFPLKTKTGLHLGFGTNWIDAAEHHLTGFFGGLSWKLNDFFSLMIENDTEKINFGSRLTILSHIQLIITFLNADTFCGGICLSLNL